MSEKEPERRAAERREQGLPPKVTDVLVLARIASIISRPGAGTKKSGMSR